MPALFWILIGVVILAALCSGGKNAKTRKQSGPREKAVRIDHPHYVDLDDSECSVCGARFRNRTMTCPRCGARFTGTKDDDEEFIEEMVIWDDDDDD